MDWDGGWWVVMAIGMILVWGLAVFGIVWVARELGSRRERSDREGDPLAILDRRLAEGAISPEEYRERRAILGGGPPDGSDTG